MARVLLSQTLASRKSFIFAKPRRPRGSYLVKLVRPHGVYFRETSQAVRVLFLHNFASAGFNFHETLQAARVLFS